jgi:hypothetical protein
MKYVDYQNNAKSFRSLKSFSPGQFVELLSYFEESHNGYFSNYTTKNKLLQEYHAVCFDMEQKHSKRFIHVLYHILESCLHQAGVIPAESQKKFCGILNRLSQENKGLPILLHDGTEQEIPRPVDSDEEKENDSGKKKKYSVKNAVIITVCYLILFISPSVCGKMRDKKIADTMYSFPKPCILYRDTGYQGFEPEDVVIKQPVKKPKGRCLTQEEKDRNKQIVFLELRIEHAIGSAKHLRIVKDECKLRANNFVKRIFVICAALHNFRIKINPRHYHI